MFHFNSKCLADGGVFIMLVGAPSCGKTTYASKIMSEYSDAKWVYISPDGIRKKLIKTDSKSVTSKHIFEMVYEKIKTALRDKSNIIYDATNCNKRYRKKLMNFIRDKCDGAICLVSVSSLTDCLRRNDNYYYPVKESVIEKMYIELWNSPPDISEGYDLIATFNVKG